MQTQEPGPDGLVRALTASADSVAPPVREDPEVAPVRAPGMPVVPTPWVTGAAWFAGVGARVSAVVLFVVQATLVAYLAGWDWADQPLWSTLTLVTIAASSLTLATYLPRQSSGWKPAIGCGPCAIAGLVMALVGPYLAIAGAPYGQMAVYGTVLAGVALARRLTEPPVCGA